MMHAADETKRILYRYLNANGKIEKLYAAYKGLVDKLYCVL